MAIVGDSDVENIPLPLDPVVDDEARQMLQDVLSRITELDRAASDAADREAERAAVLAAGQAVIEDGLTDETIDAVSEAVRPALVRWLEGFGVSGWLAVILAGILLVMLVRWLKANTAAVRSGKTKSVFSQVAAKTAWKGDNAVARQIDRRLYGVDVLKEAQAESQEDEEAQAEMPTQPPAGSDEQTLAGSDEQTLADLQAKIEALKAAK